MQSIKEDGIFSLTSSSVCICTPLLKLKMTIMDQKTCTLCIESSFREPKKREGGGIVGSRQLNKLISYAAKDLRF